jgi:hypothetical protein
MGWSGGSEIVADVAKVLPKEVKNHCARKRIYQALVDSCRSLDWDVEEEVAGIDPALDEVLDLVPDIDID